MVKLNCCDFVCVVVVFELFWLLCVDVSDVMVLGNLVLMVVVDGWVYVLL